MLQPRPSINDCHRRWGPLRLRIGELSYRQRRRIELARLVSEPMDLLLLDEPTNHLSPALVEELEEALVGYEGALVLVTGASCGTRSLGIGSPSQPPAA